MGKWELLNSKLPQLPPRRNCKNLLKRVKVKNETIILEFPTNKGKTLKVKATRTYCASSKSRLPQQSIVLKGLRGREGLSQKQLAKKIKTSRSTISKMETGRKMISSSWANKLAEALNTTPRMFEY